MSGYENATGARDHSGQDKIMTPDIYRSMFLRQFTSQCSHQDDGLRLHVHIGEAASQDLSR